MWLFVAWWLILIGLTFYFVCTTDPSEYLPGVMFGMCIQAGGFLIAAIVNQRSTGWSKNVAAVTIGMVWAWWILISVTV